MRSIIAALRTLVLPFGQTSGRRIVLDGVNGTIEIYDENNALLSRLDDTGFILFSPPGAAFVSMEPTAGRASVFLFPNDPAANSGELFAQSLSGILYSILDSPWFDGRPFGRAQLSGGDATGAIRPQLRLLSIDSATGDLVPGNISVSISGDLEFTDGGTVTSKLIVENVNFQQHLRLDRPGVNNLELQPSTNFGGVCQVAFNDIVVAAIGPNGLTYSDGAPIPRIRAGKTTMTFSASDTALATIDYGFTFPAPPSVTATLSGGGIDQFALRMGTVGTSSVVLRANTHDSASISGDFEVNWIASQVT